MLRSEIKRAAFIKRPAATPKPAAGPKQRKCCVKACRAPFLPSAPFQRWCGPDCGAIVAMDRLQKQKAKTARADRAETKLKLKRRADFISDAQTAFNAFIRQRDIGLPCICCGRTSDTESRGGTWDAGHYRSRGSAPHMRFVENNVHAQLKSCNRYGAGRAVDYRIGLVARIGLEAVEALEADNTVRKWTIPELVAIKLEYVAKLRQIKLDSVDLDQQIA